MDTDLSRLKEDIWDMEIARDQAYEDLIKATAWYNDREQKLNQMQKALQDLEK